MNILIHMNMFIYFFICIYKENKSGWGGYRPISTYIKAVANDSKNLTTGVIGGEYGGPRGGGQRGRRTLPPPPHVSLPQVQM